MNKFQGKAEKELICINQDLRNIAEEVIMNRYHAIKDKKRIIENAPDFLDIYLN